jgi:anti-sigma regulatory factor (Ser/Thr protein kinase)
MPVPLSRSAVPPAAAAIPPFAAWIPPGFHRSHDFSRPGPAWSRHYEGADYFTSRISAPRDYFRTRHGKERKEGGAKVPLEIGNAQVREMDGHRQSARIVGAEMIFSQVFPGRPEHVRDVRHWVRDQLPPCPARDDVEVIASELAANAVVHTASGEPGGEVAAWLTWWPDQVRVVVGDGGAATAPVLVADAVGERQRGLALVAALALSWAHAGDRAGRWTWADVAWDGPPPLAPAAARPASASPPAATGLADEPARLAAILGRQCTCGFTEAADETLTDHFLAVFAPPDCRGSDGRVHEEGDRGRCLCGLTAPGPAALDDHFLSVFTPVSSIGRDGARHQPTRLRNGT